MQPAYMQAWAVDCTSAGQMFSVKLFRLNNKKLEKEFVLSFEDYYSIIVLSIIDNNWG
jgi:hypothetical protein